MSLRRRLLALVVAVTVLVTTGVAAVVAAERFLRAPVGGDGVLTVLLLGSDAGPLRGGDPRSARADAFHLVFVSPDRQHASFVNIPRDAYVPVPGRGTTRINACLNHGADNCVATVESNFGVSVDYWFLTDFRGLITGINRLGGVEVDVPQPLYDGGEDITNTGTQVLSGAQALTFARDRKNRSGGDFARSAAQTTLLQQAHRKLLREKANIGRITEMAGLVQQTTITDAAPHEVLRMAYMAMTLPPSQIANVTVPGSLGSAGGASVVFLGGRASSIIADAAADGRIGGG